MFNNQQTKFESPKSYTVTAISDVKYWVPHWQPLILRSRDGVSWMQKFDLFRILTSLELLIDDGVDSLAVVTEHFQAVEEREATTWSIRFLPVIHFHNTAEVI